MISTKRTVNFSSHLNGSGAIDADYLNAKSAKIAVSGSGNIKYIENPKKIDKKINGLRAISRA